MRKIAHIVNPVKIGIQSDLYYAQDITFETMRVAKEYVKGKLEIELFTTQYPEDHSIIPDYFIKTKDLENSVLDFNEFKKKRKLPTIKGILDRLYETTDAEYLVYTNVDIAVVPHFYETINHIIEQGYDGFIINRRRVSETYTKVEQIPMLIADVGEPHPGFDCFVFHRNLYQHYKLHNICVGIPFIGIALAHNTFCFAQRFKLFTDLHLTIHIGMEIMKNWGDKQYFLHNKQEFKKVTKELMPIFDVKKFPYFNQPFYKRYICWLLNPSMQIRICAVLEYRRIKYNIKYNFYEFIYRFIWKKS